MATHSIVVFHFLYIGKDSAASRLQSIGCLLNPYHSVSGEMNKSSLSIVDCA